MPDPPQTLLEWLEWTAQLTDERRSDLKLQLARLDLMAEHLAAKLAAERANPTRTRKRRVPPA